MNPVFITGVARSGTTLLGQLIGTLSNIEYEFQPLYLTQILVLWYEGELAESTTAQLLSNWMHESLIEQVLGRNVNLRPTDWSRFWLMKPYEELVNRWGQSDTRQDVQRRIEEKGIRLACKSPWLTPFYTFLLRNFSGGQIINITRDGFDVVVSVLKKGWFSDEGLQQQVTIVPKREVPWWIPTGMERKFLTWNAPTRALYMWRYLVEIGKKDRRVLELRYEDLLWSPQEALVKILDFLEGSEPTTKTGEVLQSIDPTRARHIELEKGLFDSEQLYLAELLMKRLGYQ